MVWGNKNVVPFTADKSQGCFPFLAIIACKPNTDVEFSVRSQIELADFLASLIKFTKTRLSVFVLDLATTFDL